MKIFKKILPVLLSLVFIFSFEVKAQSLSELISTYKSDLTFREDQGLDLITDIITFADLKRQNMSDNDLWLVDREQYPQANDADFYPEKDWFPTFNCKFWFVKNLFNGFNESTSNKFMPYVEKLVVPVGSEIVFIGDLHANANSLLSIFEDLKNLGFLDKNYICREDVNIVFLGDYVDRGKQDLQLLSLLVKFHNENSERVFLLRGNHEIFTHSPIDILRKDVLPVSYDFYQKIHRLFEYLPLALYLGCQDENGAINFLQCCHAGIEIGYNPQNLLADTSVSYQRVLGLNRGKFLLKILETKKRELAGDIFSVYEAHSEIGYLFKDISKPEFLTLANGLGFCWSDFNFDDKALSLTIDLGRGAYTYGKDITKYYLDKSSTEQFKLCGIIRGHQHNGQALLELLKNSGNVNLWDGLVYTLLSTSDLDPRVDLSEFYWPGKSFNILKMNAKPKDWEMSHFFHLKKDAPNSINIENFYYFESQKIKKSILSFDVDMSDEDSDVAGTTVGNAVAQRDDEVAPLEEYSPFEPLLQPKGAKIDSEIPPRPQSRHDGF